MPIEMQYPNLASDGDLRMKVEEELWGLLRPIRDNRQRKEETWKRYYRIYNCEFDNMSYKGFSKVYVPALKKAGEAFVDTIVQQIFPNGQWFRIKANVHITNQLQAEMWQALCEYFFTKNFKLKSEAIPFIRQLVIYGTSPMKLTWRDEEREQIVAELVKDDVSGLWVRKFAKKMVKSFFGPYLRSVDLFNFYVWPETCCDVDDAEIVFEDMEMTVGHILSMARTPVNKKKKGFGNIYYIPEDDQDFVDGDSAYAKQLYQWRAEKLQNRGISRDPSDPWNKLAKDRRNLTEIYWRRDLDGTGEKSWLLTVLNDCRVIRIQENPFNDKEPPYLVPRYIRQIGEFYGYGAYHGPDRLQYMGNDVINQTLDSVQYRLNPVTVIDPVKVRFAQSIKRHPGARLLMDPTGFLESAPIDVSGTGFNAFNLVYGLIHDSSASAALQGIPAARGRGRQQHTASGMAQSLQQSQLPLENVTEDLEEQFTKRLLRKAYNLMSQYMDSEVVCRVLGPDGTYITKPISAEDIIGDYEYEWLGVVSARNKLIMGQQMLQFLNIIRSLPPQIVQNLNWEYIINRIWTDAMGQRDSDEVFLSNKARFSIDPAYEFELLLNGREPVLSPGDNDMEHMEDHLQKRDRIPPEKEELIEKWDKHIDGHMAQATEKVRKQREQQMMQEAAKMAQIQQMTQGRQPQRGGGGGGGVQPQRNAPQNQPTGLGQNGAADAMRSLQGGVQ